MAIIDRRGVTVDATDSIVLGDPNPGLAIKAPARAATTGAITLDGLQTVDGVALLAGDRVLVKNQADARTNGLYNASTGIWQRTLDADDSSQLAHGTLVLVNSGTINATSWFTVSTADPIDLGVSNLTWQAPVLVNVPVVSTAMAPVVAAATIPAALTLMGLGSGISAAMAPVCAAATLAQAVSLLAVAGRTRLTQATTFYVATTGSDSTGDGTVGNPWKTRSHAFAVLQGQYDLAGQTVTVQLADGTYTDSFQATGSLLGQIGYGGLLFQGNTATPANCIIKPNALLGYSWSAAFGTQYTMTGFQMDQGTSLSDCISIGTGSVIALGVTNPAHITFGDLGGAPYNHITVSFGGVLYINGDYTIAARTVTTTGTFSISGTTMTVASATGIKIGMGILGTGLAAGCNVTNVVGTTVTFTPAATANETSVSVQFSSGGQCHIDMGNGAQLYYNTNGDPAFTIKVTTTGVPFFSSGFIFVNELCGANAQAITFVGGTGGEQFTVRNLSSLDTNFQGVPYFPGNLSFARQCTFSTGDTVIGTGASATVLNGRAVNGYVAPTATYSSGVTSIVVSSASFISIGNEVTGPGIVAGTTVAGISGTTITLSFATYAASGGSVAVTFTGTGIANGTFVVSTSGNNVTLSQPAALSQTAITLYFAGFVQQGSVYL